MADDHDAVVYSGNWVNGVTEDFDAALQISFFGEEITLTLGTDVDRSICDVLVDNVFWGSLDTYAATPGELAVTIPLARLGQHTLEIRNRPERNKAAVPSSATSFKLEFVQMETLYDGQTLQYSYDDLSRLLAADYFAAWDTVNPVREYDFSYDVAGNRTQEILTVDGGTPTQTDYTYDAANRISNAGFAYNDAGQMTADGTLSYSWDRAGRLLGAGDSSYAYNGLGQRVQQTVSGVVTDYLLDVQPGLAKVIAAMTGANTERFVHERGLLSQQDNGGVWHWAVNDGLGSVRVQADGDFDVEGSRLFAPYGVPFGEQGAFDVPFAFTGEMLDANGLQYHRARYYNPSLGVFPSLDPVEGVLQQAMSLNRYAYVAGNVVNLVDPSGMISESPIAHDDCYEPAPPPDDPCPPGYIDTRSQACACREFDPDCPITPAQREQICCCRSYSFGRGIAYDPSDCFWRADYEGNCWTQGEARKNQNALLDELRSPDPLVKTRGYIVGFERPIITVGVAGIVAGVSGMLVCQGQHWWEFPPLGDADCRLFASAEFGVGVGGDLSQGVTIGAVWSTAGLDDFAGISLNISADLPVPGLGRVAVENPAYPLLANGVAVNAGISLSANCHATMFIGFGQGGPFSVSGTFGLTIDVSTWADRLSRLTGPIMFDLPFLLP